MCLWRHCRRNIICLRWTDGSVLWNCAYYLDERKKKKAFQRLKRRKIRSKNNSLKPKRTSSWKFEIFNLSPILNASPLTKRKHEIGNTLFGRENKEIFLDIMKEKKKQICKISILEIQILKYFHTFILLKIHFKGNSLPIFSVVQKLNILKIRSGKKCPSVSFASFPWTADPVC